MSVDLLLGDVRSLKQKRSVLRPLIAELARRYAVSVAEVGEQQLFRRAQVGIAMVTGDPSHGQRVMDQIERSIAARPELELLSTRRWLRGEDD